MHAEPWGHRIEGEVHGTDRAAGQHVSYRIEVDLDWAVRCLQVTTRSADLQLHRDGATWSDATGTPFEHLDGCLDVDLDFTPATLAPLFRRLALRPGQEAACDVVHVPLATLVPRRGSSSVAHLEEHHFRHVRDGRSAMVHLGATGLVVEHEAGWTALAVG